MTAEQTAWRIEWAGMTGWLSPTQHAAAYLTSYAVTRTATCHNFDHTPPAPDCRCGVYASPTATDLRPFAEQMQTRQAEGRAEGVVPYLARGVLTDAVPAPPEPKYRAPIPKLEEVGDPPGTVRGRTWTITGPVIVTDAVVAAALEHHLGVKVYTVPALAQLLAAAGEDVPVTETGDLAFPLRSWALSVGPNRAHRRAAAQAARPWLKRCPR